MTESPDEGLNSLDEERARSMADEGGAAALAVEAAPPNPSVSTFALWVGAFLSVLTITLIVFWKTCSRS